ncbi:MAG: asparagine synthase (glutamine-hydrolyzing) [Alphaproteobacteria bacterium]|jgi:asparagine synthase (glutamine-hydrolysing)|nr:asparagine synthase (glutamine-hydrolyzing) [Alphaproteobacteria bacterium]
MCGIVGSLSWSTPEDPAIVKRMMESIIHRGPDAGGIWTKEPITLGHRRLSILDTSEAANQPMTDSSRRYIISFNGEIYNFHSLRNTLIEQGMTFTTNSDTEVVLAAWRLWGIDALLHLEGMFAFALWDDQEKKLYLARDRFGEKPLYYFTHSTSSIIFGSELKALQQHPLCPQSLSPKAISQFLSLNYILTESCILEDVHKLPPAHFMIIQEGEAPVPKAYWSLADQFLAPKWDHSLSQLSDLFNTALGSTIKDCTLSDVPLGAFLSGGIDSSAIVASMAKNQDSSNIKTFTIGFEDDSFNELDKAQTVASYIGVDHHWETVAMDRLSLLPKIVGATDEPFADTSMIPVYVLAGMARKDVTVCLSGDGGDELFAGYETYRADQLHRVLHHLPFKKFLSNCANALPVSLNKVSFDYKARQFCKGLQLSPQKAHYFWRTIFSEDEKKKLLRDPYAQEVIKHDPFDSFNQFYQDVKSCNIMEQHLYVDLKTWLVDDILVKVDRMSMAHSLEARAPFLNHKLAEWIIRLPIDTKINGLRTKILLKKSQESFLPLSTIYAKKEGFSAPVSQWLNRDSRDQMLDNKLFREWFNEDAIHDLWKSHESGKADCGLKLFGLLCLSLWMDRLTSPKMI